MVKTFYYILLFLKTHFYTFLFLKKRKYFYRFIYKNIYFLTRSEAEFFHEVENKIWKILTEFRLFIVGFLFKISLRYFHGALVVLKKLRTVQYKNIIFVPIFTAFSTICTNIFWRKFTVQFFLSSSTIISSLI